MNKTILGILVVVVVVVIAIVAMKKPSAAPINLKIGVISVLSGDKASYGKNFKQGMELAKDKYLKTHSNSTIELVFKDDAYDGKKGMEAFHDLLNTEKVGALVVATTPTLNAIYEEASKLSIPVISYGAQTAPESKDSVFHLFPDPIFADVALGFAMKDFAAAAPQSVVGVYTSDATFANFYGAFEQAYGTNIAEFKLDPKMTTPQVKGVAEKVVAANPQFIFMSNYAGIGSQFIKELKDLSGGTIKQKFVFDLTFNQAIADYGKALGDIKVLDGSLVVIPQSITHPEFDSAYQKKYGEVPGELADYGYDAFMVLANTKPAETSLWIEEIQKADLKGATGNIGFDEMGRRVPSFSISTMKDGKILEAAK